MIDYNLIPHQEETYRRALKQLPKHDALRLKRAYKAINRYEWEAEANEDTARRAEAQYALAQRLEKQLTKPKPAGRAELKLTLIK